MRPALFISQQCVFGEKFTQGGPLLKSLSSYRHLVHSGAGNPQNVMNVANSRILQGNTRNVLNIALKYICRSERVDATPKLGAPNNGGISMEIRVNMSGILLADVELVDLLLDICVKMSDGLLTHFAIVHTSLVICVNTKATLLPNFEMLILAGATATL